MRIPRFGLRTLRNRLALLFLAVTALALAVVIFVFLPQLHAELDAQQLRDLEQGAAKSAPRIGSVIGRNLVTGPDISRLVRTTADAQNARVTLFGVQQSTVPGPPRFYLIVDSGDASTATPDWTLVGRAARTPLQGASLAIRSGETGQVAKPLLYRGRPAWVVLFTRRFDDAAHVVALVRDRLLVASAAALLVALVGGYLVARQLTRRVQRLDAAARELAAGRQIAPLPVDSSDELGRLTQTFNEMQHQLQRVERARRDFIANASHELRTPIFSLGGFVELLQDEQLEPETRDEFLKTMREQVERLGKLAVDLLDLSRLDAGSIDIHPEQVDLDELAGAVTSEFAPAVANHRSGLEVEHRGGGTLARCDRERVAQIMRILLDNALRHTPEGTPVTVSVDRNNGAAEFAVADRGPGVDPAQHLQLFERFHTGNAASGSGLGLAIAKELAERMDGRISLQSRPGKTIFTLALPADGQDESA